MDKIDAIRCFVRVVQLGSFTAAADEMNITQGAISKKVTKLETDLTFTLLHRTSRQLALTELGQQYFTYCCRMLEEQDEVESSLRSQQQSIQGTIRLSVPSSLGPLLLAEPIAVFLKQYTEVSVDITVDDRLSDLVSDNIDIAIRANKLADSSLKARYLFDSNVAYCASQAYLDTNGVPYTPESLLGHNCLTYSLIQSTKSWAFDAVDRSRQQFEVTGNFSSDNADMLLAMAKQGVGIVALPYWMVESEIKAGKLVEILKGNGQFSLPVYAIYKNSPYTPTRIRLLIDALHQSLTKY